MEAVERLAGKPILSARDVQARQPPTMQGRSRTGAVPYGVKGMKHFARDVSRDYNSTANNEGRVDAEGDAIEIITIHSAKRLEWPVVIPINTRDHAALPREPFVHRADDNTLHWVIADVVPPEPHAALDR